MTPSGRELLKAASMFGDWVQTEEGEGQEDGSAPGAAHVANGGSVATQWVSVLKEAVESAGQDLVTEGSGDTLRLNWVGADPSSGGIGGESSRSRHPSVFSFKFRAEDAREVDESGLHDRPLDVAQREAELERLEPDVGSGFSRRHCNGLPPEADPTFGSTSAPLPHEFWEIPASVLEAVGRGRGRVAGLEASQAVLLATADGGDGKVGNKATAPWVQGGFPAGAGGGLAHQGRLSDPAGPVSPR